MPYKDRKSPEALTSNRKAGRKYYEKNKAAQLVRNKNKKDQIRSYIRQYKEHHGCMDCKVKTYPYYVLDFDHRDPQEKLRSPSTLANGNSWKNMLEEIAKCDVVCANCHRERTHKGNHYAFRKEEVS
jgi:hypothetical protein